MIIPKLHYCSTGESVQQHLDHIQKACTAGVELIQLGTTGVKKKQLDALAKEALKLTAHYQTRLIINCNYRLAREIKADGLYFDDIKQYFSKARKELYTWQSLGAAAHTLQECEALLKAEVDYIVLGPFRLPQKNEPTPGVLGQNGYSLITEALNTETPILAFGEITTADINELIDNGVSGILLSNELTTDFNQVRTYNQLLNASATEEQRHSFE
ncbi:MULTISPECIES: thiamine phosphate synthase [unclassified Leeuwenhoekiella]|uniref:thiamine phosphate synthase n=1 Tax=unclassified Leeuwenhoekiella TaxID=2615029 RepID=UPI000C402E4B|nr:MULTISPECIES: thiamine phosphate synthase [unclassified Leeuwenhoekiella]MAW95300.1 thiamine phosphate synthase [Leeuwenhoekiella sp.]MBA81777.1 thiamine phosphate synthase [Leeuwenhoekiella sp.]|tara:strand:- start:4355 stop:4999 length:645 start_codon:yes stop_codon:yes gene_type:complete